MTRAVRLDREAEEELQAAAAWYANDLDLERPSSERFSLAPGVPSELGVRRVLLQRFPYALVYLELDHEIRILAVAHSRRRPGYWLDRIPR